MNRAWGTYEYPRYRLPFKNLLMVGIVASVFSSASSCRRSSRALKTYVWATNPPRSLE